MPHNESDITMLLILGLLPDTSKGPMECKICSRETAGIIALGWRCLYAEIIRCRKDKLWEDLNLKKALSRTISMLVSRITAYGRKWKLWYMKTRNTSNAKLIARKHQNYKLIKISRTADYEVNSKLKDALTT